MDTRLGSSERPALGLHSQRRLDAATAAQVAREFYALNPAHPDGEIRSCPMDDCRYEIYVFRYPDRPDVDVWVSDPECRDAGNGRIFVEGSITDD